VDAGLVVDVGDRGRQVETGTVRHGSFSGSRGRARKALGGGGHGGGPPAQVLGQDRPERGRPGIAIELASRTMAR
jgi:hypothetical protein